MNQLERELLSIVASIVLANHNSSGPDASAERAALRKALGQFMAAFGSHRTPPTISELEAILNSEDSRPVEIMPDGTVRDIGGAACTCSFKTDDMGAPRISICESCEARGRS